MVNIDESGQERLPFIGLGVVEKFVYEGLTASTSMYQQKFEFLQAFEMHLQLCIAPASGFHHTR